MTPFQALYAPLQAATLAAGKDESQDGFVLPDSAAVSGNDPDSGLVQPGLDLNRATPVMGAGVAHQPEMEWCIG